MSSNYNDKKFDQALSLLYEGREEEAIKILKLLYGDSPEFYTKFGLLLNKCAEKNPEKYAMSAFMSFLDGADGGDAEAQYWVAHYYHTGMYGIALDYEEAANYITESIQQNYIPAWELLGSMYESGYEFGKDLRKAFECYLRGAKLGDGLAQIKLAQCYYYGQGTEKNDVKAKSWLAEASKNKIDEKYLYKGMAEEYYKEWFGSQNTSSGGKVSWVVSIILILGGIGAFSEYGFIVGVLWCIAGLVLCPVVNKNMKIYIKIILAIILMWISSLFL